MRLRRSDCSAPGLRRRRAGRGFVYLGPTGAQVQDPDVLARIQALAIPPAWQDVWICPWPNGHIQAMGTDAKGRRQYLYHPVWRQQRDREKFEHMLEVAAELPAIRRRCRADLALEGLGRERVLAAAVRLLDVGFFRVGGEEYQEENGSFGLATILKRHTRVRGDEIVFEYPAKSGRHRVQSVVDPAVHEVVSALKRRRGGGPELLAYRAGARWVDVRSQDVNDYLQEISRVHVSAKDFRTWHATVLAAVSLSLAWQAGSSAAARKRAVSRAMQEVSTYLGNTPAVCRTSYVDPRVVDHFRSGTTVLPALEALPSRESVTSLAQRDAVERAVVALLTGEEEGEAAA
jgi:DNA topoisomerase IB